MTISEIIYKVKSCIDENVLTSTNGISSVNEYTLMEDIIKAHIEDAMRWCVVAASYSMRNVSYQIGSGQSVNMMETLSLSGTASSLGNSKYCTITLPDYTSKVIRVRNSNWYKGVSNFVNEDSDEYLELRGGDIVAASNDRPVAAIINTYPIRIELYPYTTNSTNEVTILREPSDLDIEITPGVDININLTPSKLGTAFIYYLSFLVLSAYNDINKANQMLAIAKMSIGAATTQE